ncbi:hypothetical protein HHK36_020891 [Tetracentron sinense]|uniref:Pentatricopeptide repeat-containing protein n=1 Tax=Tetracentron sinense TaxID=13715 RepID=A0A834YVY8_TETSI|nr:hypothetical protein HHK36_020891 [Tetracentron sinense]
MFIQNPRRVLLFGTVTARRLCTVASKPQTQTQTQISSRNWWYLNKSRESSSLYHRITALDATDGSVSQALDQWVMGERKSISKYDIIGFVDQLRKYKQYTLALQLLEWLENNGIEFSYGEHARRINLLWKIRGIASAEKYFTDLPEPAKSNATYGTLLNCYCNEKLTDKAMELLETMRELNFASTYAYNSLMCLYMKLGKHEKVPLLLQEMKGKCVVLNLFSYNMLMSSYVALKDIEGAERVLIEMETGGGVKPEWSVYGQLTAMYISASLFEKADLALKKLERKKKDREAFHHLLSLYASIGNASEVNRIWQSLKSSFPRTANVSYLTMLQSLYRLDDLDGLQKYFEEWESDCSCYDIRLVNVLIRAYLKRDMLAAAELLLENAVKKGAKRNYMTIMVFVEFYMKNRHMDLALKCMKTAIPEVKEHEWQMYREKASVFLKYFEEEKDVDGAEELYRILKQANCLDKEVYDSLFRTYIAAGKVELQMRQRMKADGVEIVSETEKLLESVCPKLDNL